MAGRLSGGPDMAPTPPGRSARPGGAVARLGNCRPGARPSPSTLSIPLDVAQSPAFGGASEGSMAVRDGQAFIKGLRDTREVWYDGRRVDDVTTFPEFTAAIQSLARLYDMQHETAHRDVLAVHDPALGEVIGRAFQLPRTAEDLRLRREAAIRWAEATCGMMGRSPDFLNAMITSIAAKRGVIAEYSPARAEAVAGYYRHV